MYAESAESSAVQYFWILLNFAKLVADEILEKRYMIYMCALEEEDVGSADWRRLFLNIAELSLSFRLHCDGVFKN